MDNEDQLYMFKRKKEKLNKTHNEILLSCKKGGNLIMSNRMDGPGEHYAKWKKPVREKQEPYDFPQVESNEQNELTSKPETDSLVESR